MGLDSGSVNYGPQRTTRGRTLAWMPSVSSAAHGETGSLTRAKHPTCYRRYSDLGGRQSVNRQHNNVLNIEFIFVDTQDEVIE